MSFALGVRADIKEAERYLTRVERRQVPFATALALTRTAQDAQRAETRNVRKQLDNPVVYTQRAFGVIPAKKRDMPMRSSVFIKDRQYEYLKYQIDGGQRLPKRRAIPVPGRELKTNKYGNMPRGKIQRLLARPDTFSGVVNGVPGIYQRMRRRGPKLLVLYASQANYQRRFYFYRTAEMVGRNRFAKNFDDAMKQALK
ncbi:MAG: hypothetical protein AAF542_17850 [Pseudomonadota bacterium]